MLKVLPNVACYLQLNIYTVSDTNTYYIKKKYYNGSIWNKYEKYLSLYNRD